uniref:Uncharacterized protein n=1 Tax=Populus trichocarpa TaxID=3694 RepID=A0A2K2AEQ7_POPTR
MRRLKESRPSLFASRNLSRSTLRLDISKSFFSLSDVLLVFYSSKQSYSSTRKRDISPNILWHKTLSSTMLTSILSIMAIWLKTRKH